MPSENSSSRLPLLLGGLFVLAMVATIVLVVIVRMQLTAEERMFVGAWRIQMDSDDETSVLFLRANRTGETDGYPIGRWSVHGTQFTVRPTETATWQEFRDRLIGVASAGPSLEIEELTHDRIVLSDRYSRWTLTRVDGPGGDDVE